MLKSNSKQVKEAINAYILENYNNEEEDITDLEEIKKDILRSCFEAKINTFRHLTGYERIRHIEEYIRHFYKNSYFEIFKDWCQGLPSIFDTCYYYNVNAKEIIKEWLQETEEEADKYTEDQAEELITKLLYRELTRDFNFNNIIYSL